AQLGIDLAIVVLNTDVRHDDVGSQAVGRTYTDQEEAILRYPRAGPFADMRQPLRLKSDVDEVPQIYAFSQGISADGKTLFRKRTGGREARGDQGRKRKDKAERAHGAEPLWHMPGVSLGPPVSSFFYFSST